jgi:hypothetical protein
MLDVSNGADSRWDAVVSQWGHHQTFGRVAQVWCRCHDYRSGVT